MFKSFGKAVENISAKSVDFKTNFPSHNMRAPLLMIAFVDQAKKEN